MALKASNAKICKILNFIIIEFDGKQKYVVVLEVDIAGELKMGEVETSLERFHLLDEVLLEVVEVQGHGQVARFEGGKVVRHIPSFLKPVTRRI